MKLRILSPILSSLLVLSIPQAIQSKETSTAKELGIGLAIVGAVGLVVGGMISAVSSWFEVSNASLIAEGQALVALFNETYHPIREKIVMRFGTAQLASDFYNWKTRIDENLFYEIACDMHNQGICWQIFSNTTSTCIYNVNQYTSKIAKRIAKTRAKKKIDFQERKELKELQELEESLTWVYKEISQMYDYLCVRHGEYFRMAFYECKLCKKYAHEIALLDGSVYTTLHLDQAISGVVSQNSRNTRYAYMKYYTDLVSELDTLRSIRAGIAYGRYPERCAWTDRVIARLHQLATIVEPWYRYEYGLYQAEEAERRRIELEQERIRLLREHNEAIRQQNRELERQRHQREIETTVATAALINGLIHGPRVEERRTDVQVSIEVVS